MFAAVLLQINLIDHRVMFRTYAYTFTTEEAAKTMATLVFTHIQRKPDPQDPTRQIATRTTTTFSMDSSAAKALLQQFLLAGLIINATDPTNMVVRDRGIFSPTLKGKYVLEEFVDTTQIEMPTSLIAAFNAPHMTTSASSTGNRVIVLDRMHDDQITFSRPNITAIFKAMAASLPKEALIPDIFGGIETRHVEIYQYTFLGQQCMEWLYERLTVNSREEAETVASEFVLFGWLAQILDKSDRSHLNVEKYGFNSSRNSIYYVTDRGCAIIGWKAPEQQQQSAISNNSAASSVHSDTSTSAITKTTHTDSKKESLLARQDSGNSSTGNYKVTSEKSRPSSISIADSSALAQVSTTRTRLAEILESPLMRMYFRDFLRSNYCVENINFWVDHHKLLKKNQNNKLSTVMEQLVDCYIMYESYLGPNAADPINIDHTLHQEVVSYVNTVFLVVAHPPQKAPYFFVAANKKASNHNNSDNTIIMNHNNSNQNSKSTLLITQPSTKQKVVSIRGGVSPDQCLAKLLSCYAKVNEHVCLMMAEDSVPKFIKTQKYRELLLKQQEQKEREEENDEEEEDFVEFEDSSDEEEQQVKLKTSFLDQRTIMVKHHHNTTLAL